MEGASELARPLPFALRSAVEAELDRLEAQGILEPTQHSEWATPLVLVRKSDGQLRLCGDYRSTMNAATQKAAYPLPTAEEALSHLQGGKIFSTLNLAQAYQQLPVTPEMAALLTINTLQELYRVKRLPFGVAAAPAVFLRFMETTLSGIPGTCVYLDDIRLQRVDGQGARHSSHHGAVTLESSQLALEPREVQVRSSRSTFFRTQVGRGRLPHDPGQGAGRRRSTTTDV